MTFFVPGRDPGYAIAPAGVHAPGLEQALYQELLQMILLKIDEGGILVASLRKQVEAYSSRSRRNTLPWFQTTPLADGPLAAAQPVENLQRALGEADGAAAFGQRRFLVHQHAVDAVQRESIAAHSPTGPAPTTITR